MDWNSLGSALVGGGLAVVASIVAHWLQQRQKKNEDTVNIKATLQALHDEIEALWANYMVSIGQLIEGLPTNQPLAFYFPVTQDYFTVYTSNARLIGRIDDAGKRKLIISTYAKAKGLIDSYKMNNEILAKYENLHFLAQQNNAPPILAASSSALAALTTYAAKLQTSHFIVKQQVSDLLAVLKD